VFRTGACLRAVLEVTAAIRAKNVVWNRRYEPRQLQVDRQVEVRPLLRCTRHPLNLVEK
jgi:deoxyribodipyrimidine photolyase